jgi:HD-GYP domain-containing protein (c-di-GMP phosphodiesterase class II)
VDAVEELQRCAGSHFDAEVVAAFQRAFPDVSVLPLGT